MAIPLNIIGGWYSDVAKPWTQQDICNYIPFVAEQKGPISAIEAVDAPGLKPFVEIASDGGIRGAKNVEGKLLVVAGTELYQISNSGIAIPRGTIPGTGLVSIDYNQQGIANQVLIGNGSAGYVYDTALLTLERITDPGFPGTKAVAYLDSYLLGVEPLGRFWFHSNLTDATDYNTLDRYEAETAPDRIVTLAVSNEEVVVFGQSTTDFFVNTGETTGTFQSKGVSMDVGCASAASVVKLDNTLFWLDNYGVFQRLNGYSPQPVSTRVLESAIADFDWSKCRATVYQDRGRKIVYWTFPHGLTLGYDVTTGMWHRREAYGMTTDRISTITFWNRKWIAGDVASGRLYELDWDYMLQVDQPHIRKLKTAPMVADRHRLRLNMAELVFDTGGPETVAIPFPVQPEGPTITAPPLPDGIVGQSWAGGTYTATGGTPPYTFTTRPGSTFPGNLGPMSSAGVVASETPTAAGAGINIARVTDANGLPDDVTDTFEITVAPGAMMAQTRSTDTITSTDGGVVWTATANNPAAANKDIKAVGSGRFVANLRYTDDRGATAWSVATATETKGYQGTSRGSYVICGSNGPFEPPSISSDNGVTSTSGGASGNGMYSPLYMGVSGPIIAVGKGLNFTSSADNAATFASTGVAHGFLDNNTSNASHSYSGGGVYAGTNVANTALRVVFTEDGLTFTGGDITGLGNSAISVGKNPSMIAVGEVGGIETIVVLAEKTGGGELFWTQDPDNIAGPTWHLVTDPLGAGVQCDAIAWNGVRFVLGGHAGSTGHLKHSTTLTAWTNCTFPASNGYYAIASQPAP